MNALVLSAGGMFGAYQVGAWKVLADVFQPDLIVGASIGAVNGWAIAAVRGPDVTWQHLVASTAIVGLFDQVRIDGRLYSDGGELSAVPLWAAAELGASKALVIDVLPQIPGLVAKTFVGAMKLLSPFRAIVPASMKVVRLAPPKLLGAPLDAIYWKRSNVEQWIRAGERDAAAIKHSIPICFGAE